MSTNKRASLGSGQTSSRGVPSSSRTNASNPQSTRTSLGNSTTAAKTAPNAKGKTVSAAVVPPLALNDKDVEEKNFLGEVVGDFVWMWENMVAGVDVEEWARDLVEDCIAEVFDKIVVHLRGESKMRLQTTFSRPPKQEDVTLKNVGIMARINDAVRTDLENLISPRLSTHLSRITIQISQVAIETREFPPNQNQNPTDTDDNSNNAVAVPSFSKIRESGSKLVQLQHLKEIKLSVLAEVEELIRERDELMVYFGFPAQDLFFDYGVGTSKVPLQQVREDLLAPLQTLDDKIGAKIEAWEQSHSRPFVLDGVRFLDTQSAKIWERCVEEVKGSAGGSVGAAAEKGKAGKTAGKPTPTKDPKADQKKKSAPTNLPPGLARMANAQFQTIRDLPPAQEDNAEYSQEDSQSNSLAAQWFDEDASKLFRVVIRLRPLITREIESGDTISIEPHTDNKTVKFKQAALAINTVSLMFDWCVSGHVTQDEFFQQSGVEPLLDVAVNKFENVTVMAYGQTGSGKTFSMSGPEEFLGANSSDEIQDPNVPKAVREICRSICATHEKNQGLTPRSIKTLFRLIRTAEHSAEGRKKNLKYTVEASYAEIYNEKVQDLLDPAEGSGGSGLNVRQGADKQHFFVADLSRVEVKRPAELMRLFVLGSFNRQVANTRMNSESSRSHSLFTIYLTAKENHEQLGEVVHNSKVVLVDLAGSERLKQIGRGDRDHEETSNINKSLFALSNVISRLGAGAGDHVPFRDSNLTKLLMDSIGGSGKSLLITCMSPSGRFVDESVNSLSFASKAANIQKKEVVQLTPHQLELKRLTDIIHQITAERDQFKSEATQLREFILKSGLKPPQIVIPTDSQQQTNDAANNNDDNNNDDNNNDDSTAEPVAFFNNSPPPQDNDSQQPPTFPTTTTTTPENSDGSTTSARASGRLSGRISSGSAGAAAPQRRGFAKKI